MKKQNLKIDSPEYRDILYKLQNTKISLPPLSTSKSTHSSASSPSSKTLTEVKDVDLLILSELDDRDLFNMCLVNKYANKLCQNEDFWKNRFMTKFGSTAQKHSSRFKLRNVTWRNTYLKIVQDLQFFSTQPWEIFNFISYNVKSDNVKISTYIDEKRIYRLPKDDESFIPLSKSSDFAKNNFWLTNLGNHIKLEFIPYDVSTIREYKKENDFFTPEQVLDLIREFFMEPATLQEYEEYKQDMEEDDEEIRYKESDVIKKRVRHMDLLPDGDLSEIRVDEDIKTVIVD